MGPAGPGASSDAVGTPGLGASRAPDGPVLGGAGGGDLVRFEARAMASPLRLTVPAAIPESHALILWAEVRAEFEATEQALSRFRETSDLTAANRSAGGAACGDVDARLRRALVAADRAHRMTNGRFDPRIISDLERLGYAGAPLGSVDAPPAGTRSRERLVAVEDPTRVRLAAPVDLGGIGKGLALRWAAARLRRLLPTGPGVLLEAGGDLVATGARSAGASPFWPGPGTSTPGTRIDAPTIPWLVALEDPLERDAGPAVVAVDAGAVATSSVRLRRWQGPDGTPVHHLLDPTTGRPGGDGLLAVTVAAPDPAWAEVRSKELFLAGRRDVAGLARSLGLAAWWIDVDGRLEMTPAARQRTVWVASEADAAD